MNNITYEKEDKIYKMPKRKVKRKIKVKILMIISILVILIGLLLLYNNINNNDSNDNITYNEKGSSDYTVYLKENTYYENNYLDKSIKSIISDLINTINVDFNYEINSSENIDYNNTYKIIGTLNIKEKGTNLILFTKDYNLLNEKTTTINSNNLIINEDIDIDYNKYNDYANKFKQDYGLSADAELIVKLIVNTNGEVKNNNISLNKDMTVTIPLTTQTITIEQSNAINNNQIIEYKNNISNLILPSLLIIIGLILLIYSIIKNNKISNNDLYQKELDKILKENDTHIVNAKSSYIEDSNVIRVDNFNELLDARKIEDSPILFYEVESGNKAYFVVKGKENTYRFTLTRAYQEKNNK